MFFLEVMNDRLSVKEKNPSSRAFLLGSGKASKHWGIHTHPLAERHTDKGTQRDDFESGRGAENTLIPRKFKL